MGHPKTSYLKLITLLLSYYLLHTSSYCLGASAGIDIIAGKSRVCKTQGINNNVISGGQSTCLNGGITINGSTASASNGAAINYQWLISINGNPNAFIPVTVNGNARDYYPQGLVQNTWFKRVVTASGFPPDTSNTLGVYIKYVATWLGTIDSNWNNPANWADNMLPCPGNQIEVSINALRPLAVVNNQNINTLYIAAGKSIIMNIPNTVLSIDNYNWGEGTIQATAGTVSYNSSITPKIFDGTYNRLEINSQTALVGNIMIKDYVSANGILRLQGHLILDSGANHLIQAIQTEGQGRVTIKRIGPGAKSGPVLFPMFNNYLYLTNTGVTEDYTLYTADSICQTYTNNVPSGPRITTASVNKIWVLNENTPGGSNLSLQLNWRNTQELPGFNRAQCYGVRYSSGWGGYTVGPASGVAPFYSRTLSNVTAVGVFGIGSSGSLPVELLEFAGNAVGDHARLNWRTASERNNRAFRLERSTNNIDYETIATLDGSGNSSQERNYTYTDLGVSKLASTIYYRLIQVDFNGQETVFPITTVSFEAAVPALLSAYPNPAKDFVEVHLKATTGNTLLSINDVTGRLIEQHALAGNDTRRINLFGMENGVYFIRVRTENGQEETLKLIKHE